MTQLAMNSTNEDEGIFHGESYGLWVGHCSQYRLLRSFSFFKAWLFSETRDMHYSHNVCTWFLLVATPRIMSIVGIDNTAGGIVGTTLSVWISEVGRKGSFELWHSLYPHIGPCGKIIRAMKRSITTVSIPEMDLSRSPLPVSLPSCHSARRCHRRHSRLPCDDVRAASVPDRY